MPPTITLAVLVERIDNLKETLDEVLIRDRSDVNTKHIQNRKDIHQMRNDIQQLTNQIWLIKIKLAVYAAIGGGFGSGSVFGILKLIEHLNK